MEKINWTKCLRLNLLTILTVGGVIAGVLIAIIMRQSRDDPWTEREVLYVQFLGDLFLRMLKALILPLIVASLISAIGSLDLSLSRKIGGLAIAYYMLTTVMAIVLGIILVTTIRPGVSIDQISAIVPPATTEQRNITTTDTLLDLVRNMFAPNLVQACFSQFQTVLVAPQDYVESDLSKWHVTGKFVDGMNILGLVVASSAFGVAISSTRPYSENLLKVFQELSHVIMRLTTWVIWLSPIGVLFLICAKLIELDNVEEIAGKLGMYFVTVSVGILFHGFAVLPTIYFLFTRNNPLRFISNMGSAIATAFGTSSSSATLPVSIQCLEEKNKTDPRVARFVLPIGATINMDGTALYEAVAAIFIAQVRGLSLSFGNIIAISITATAASIGAAGIPQAGLVTMVMVLDAIGLPAEDVSLILAVDWLLDRFRTVVNVLGDAFGAGIVEHLSQNELRQLDGKASDDEDCLPATLTSSSTTIIDERM